MPISEHVSLDDNETIKLFQRGYARLRALPGLLPETPEPIHMERELPLAAQMALFFHVYEQQQSELAFAPETLPE